MNDRLDKAIRAATANIVAAAPRPPTDPVAAAHRRNIVPFWVLPALVLLPVFGFIYVRALTDDSTSAPGPLATGAELYSRCATCHGGDGGGVDGQGYQFSGGEILATFPQFEDQLRFVFYGTDRYRQAGVEIYGDPNRSGGPHLTGSRGSMPPFGAELTPAEIVAVVCHERFTIGGADPGSDDFAEEYDTWCSPDAVVSAALSDGDLELVDTGADRITIDGTDVTVTPIGPAPIPGSGRE